MKQIKLSLILIIGFLLTVLPNNVDASTSCYTKLQNTKTMNVGDTFTYELGINGITTYTSVYGFHYEIEYDPEVLTPILDENNGMGSYYNWETKNAYVYENDYNRLNTLIVDMQTSYSNRQISYSISSGNNIKLGYIKFKVNETNVTNTTLTLLNSNNYQNTNNTLVSYKYIVNNNSSNKYTTEACTNNSKTQITIKQNTQQNIVQNGYQNAYLTAITVDGLTINNFNSNNYSYSFETTQRALNMRAYAPNGFTITGDVGYKTVNYGSNQYKIQVTSPTGDRKEYIINVNLPDNRSKTNTLNYLSTSEGNINFKSYTNYYSITVPNNVHKISISSGLTDGRSSYVSGYGNRDVTLYEGSNEVLVKVRAENGNINTYTINVFREKSSSSCNIEDIYIDDYDFDFNTYQTNYKLNVRPKTTKLDISVYLEDEESDYRIYGNKNLDTGSTIRIEVTDKYENTKNYYINITKEETIVEKESIALPIAIFVILILIALIVIICLRRRKEQF